MGSGGIFGPHYEHRPYEKWGAYGQAKTANVLFAVGLEAGGASKGVHAFAVHPGGIVTDLMRHLSTEEQAGFGVIDGKATVAEVKSPVIAAPMRFKTGRAARCHANLGSDERDARRQGRRLL